MIDIEEIIFWTLFITTICFSCFAYKYNLKNKILEKKNKWLKEDLKITRDNFNELISINKDSYEEFEKFREDYHNLMVKYNKIIAENYILKEQNKNNFNYTNTTFKK